MAQPNNDPYEEKEYLGAFRESLAEIDRKRKKTPNIIQIMTAYELAIRDKTLETIVENKAETFKRVLQFSQDLDIKFAQLFQEAIESGDYTKAHAFTDHMLETPLSELMEELNGQPDSEIQNRQQHQLGEGGNPKILPSGPSNIQS